MAPVTRKRISKYSPEQKQAWKQERMQEQKDMLAAALTELANSDTWQNWIKFGRPNLKRLSFQNALLIFTQRQNATVVWGAKQWEKQKVTINPDAQKIRYLAPCFIKAKDTDGSILYGADGKPVMKVGFYKVVTGYDVGDTDAPKTVAPDISVDGDDLMEHLPALEQFARELGYTVKYKSDTGNAHGWVDERMWQIVINSNLSGNGLVRTLFHELCHAYGNVNYTDFTREEAEVLVESATVMGLSILGYDVSQASVPYIAGWGGDLKVLDKYAKLVEELVNKLTEKMGV